MFSDSTVPNLADLVGTLQRFPSLAASRRAYATALLQLAAVEESAESLAAQLSGDTPIPSAHIRTLAFRLGELMDARATLVIECDRHGQAVAGEMAKPFQLPPPVLSPDEPLAFTS